MRLVGFEPTLRISGIRLILEAHSRHLSQLRSASLELDAALIETFEAGDLLTLVRTPTADIAVGVERQRRLIAAIGAVTVIPLGDMVAVVGGPTIDVSTPDRWPRSETWVDVSVSGETRRLHGGDDVTVRDYCVSVIRTFEDGVPATTNASRSL
jgi:hypothetical protein